VGAKGIRKDGGYTGNENLRQNLYIHITNEFALRRGRIQKRAEGRFNMKNDCRVSDNIVGSLVPMLIANGAESIELPMGTGPAVAGVEKMAAMAARRTVDAQIIMALESPSVA
jgi:hypothetical protein